MKLVLKSKAKPETKRKRTRKGIPRFVFELPKEDRDKLNELAQWYSKQLKVKVSAATLLRLSLKDFLREHRNGVKSAVEGRYHAKLRKLYCQ